MHRKLSGLVAVLAAGTLAAPGAATAHPGHDGHDTPPPPPDSGFQKVTLNDRPGEPMDLAVLPDGSVLHTTRAGTIWRNDAGPA